MKAGYQELFEKVRNLWDEAFAPHFLPHETVQFEAEMAEAEAACDAGEFVRAVTIVRERLSWAEGQTYTADVSGPSLSYFDMVELLEELVALLETR